MGAESTASTSAAEGANVPNIHEISTSHEKQSRKSQLKNYHHSDLNPPSASRACEQKQELANMALQWLDEWYTVYLTDHPSKRADITSRQPKATTLHYRCPHCDNNHSYSYGDAANLGAPLVCEAECSPAEKGGSQPLRCHLVAPRLMGLFRKDASSRYVAQGDDCCLASGSCPYEHFENSSTTEEDWLGEALRAMRLNDDCDLPGARVAADDTIHRLEALQKDIVEAGELYIALDDISQRSADEEVARMVKFDFTRPEEYIRITKCSIELRDSSLVPHFDPFWEDGQSYTLQQTSKQPNKTFGVMITNPETLNVDSTRAEARNLCTFFFSGWKPRVCFDHKSVEDTSLDYEYPADTPKEEYELPPRQRRAIIQDTDILTTLADLLAGEMGLKHAIHHGHTCRSCGRSNMCHVEKRALVYMLLTNGVWSPKDKRRIQLSHSYFRDLTRKRSQLAAGQLAAAVPDVLFVVSREMCGCCRAYVARAEEWLGLRLRFYLSPVPEPQPQQVEVRPQVRRRRRVVNTIEYVGVME